MDKQIEVYKVTFSNFGAKDVIMLGTFEECNDYVQGAVNPYAFKVVRVA